MKSELTKFNWAIINYYRCKIHESNNEREEIKNIVKLADEKLYDNGYNDLFMEWR